MANCGSAPPSDELTHCNPPFVARLWNGEEFSGVNDHIFHHFPRSSIEWPVFSCRSLRSCYLLSIVGMDPVLVLDLSPNCGLPGVGYLDAGWREGCLESCWNTVSEKTQKHRERERERKRDQPTQRVLQFIID